MRPRVVALAAPFLLGACGSVLAPPAAVVGGHKIPARTVTDALHAFEATSQFDQSAQLSGRGVVARQFEQSYLARLIRRYVLGSRARELGVQVTGAEVSRGVNRIESSFPTQASFDKALADQGLTLPQLRLLLRDRILERKLRARVTQGVAKADRDTTWQQWVTTAYREARVNVNPSYGTFNLQTQTIVDRAASFPGAATPSPTSSPAG